MLNNQFGNKITLMNEQSQHHHMNISHFFSSNFSMQLVNDQTIDRRVFVQSRLMQKHGVVGNLSLHFFEGTDTSYVDFTFFKE